MSYRALLPLLSFMACAGLGSAPAATAAANSAPVNDEPPRLAIVISVDQLRADYLQRFAPHFTVGGFRRFLDGGAVFLEAHHRHALTSTAPGHATLMTGVHAERHGIIGNDWRDAETLQAHTSVSDPSSQLVGVPPPAPGPGGIWAAAGGASPHRLLATTVGDQLKLRFGARSRVIGLGHKDRSPILMAGRLADGAYWRHDDKFVTSTYYTRSLPPWVERFNQEDRINRVFGTTWDRLLEPALYHAVQGPDDAAGEENGADLGRTFPRQIDGGAVERTRAFYDSFPLTPAADEILLELAERAVTAEQLGQRDAPDLLCLGFSTLDYTGHAFGPDSHEVMDIVLRLDRLLERFFGFLDTAVGAGRYVVVLSADHGVAPLPERVQAMDRGVTAGRLDVAALLAVIRDELNETFGAIADDRAWVVRDGYGFRLQTETLRERGVDAKAAAQAVQRALLNSGQIAVAFTREEMQAADVGRRHFGAWRLSFHDARSPDVVFSAHPYVVDRRPVGTNHGSPYRYDTHVPLAWFGAGVPQVQRTEVVGTDSLAPTLSALLGIPAPPDARAPRLF